MFSRLRILHISDIHCADAMLTSVLEREEYDIVAVTGDIECVETARILVDYARGSLVAVTGNIDTAATARILRDAGVLLDGRVHELKGLVFAGLGGLDLASSISSLRDRLSKSDVKRVDVLLSHHPPKGILDKALRFLHIGVREVSEIVELVHPRAHLFGHVHESRGVLLERDVLFVNAGPLKRGYYALVDCVETPCRAELKKL